MITFKGIEIEGFGSIIQKIYYPLDRVGLNLILGKNGVGKTTLINALCWGLYKQTLKKNSTIEPWPQLLDSEYQGLMVRVLFKDEEFHYEVIRCKEYTEDILGKKGNNRLLIIQNGKEREDLRDKSDAEKWIKEKLGYSFELFKNTIAFGQKLKRLSDEDGPTKKKVFDEAFETLFINRAREIASKKLDDLNKEFNELTIKSEAELKIQNNLQEQFRSVNDLLKNFESGKKERIDILKNEILEIYHTMPIKKGIKKLSNQLAVLKAYKTDWSEREFRLNMEINGKKSKVGDLESRIKTLNGKIKKYPKECDECGQKLPKSYRQKYISTLRNQVTQEFGKLLTLQAEIARMEETYKNVLVKLEQYKKRQKLISVLEAKIRSRQNNLEKIKIYDKQVEDKEKEMENIRQLKMPNVNLDEIRSKGLAQEEVVQKINDELKAITKKKDTYEWLMDKPLSNSGLKAFIFDAMLSKVNRYANKYKHLIGFGIKVYVDMSSAHKNIMMSVFKGSEEVPYEDLSGGQRQLVDVVIAFSLNDTVDSIKPTNLLFLDEVFESLDEDNIEVVGDLIAQKAKNKSIHLITHHSKFNPSNVHQTFVTLNNEGHTEVSAS